MRLAEPKGNLLMTQNSLAARNGWALYTCSAFREAYEPLEAEVARLELMDPENLPHHPKAKLLKRINDLIFDEIPTNPANPAYRLGQMLGSSHKNWQRAKFLRRFRLFFRYDTKSRMIVYCWLNDENTLRRAGDKNDPYVVFAAMLERGHPPSSWLDLQREVARIADCSPAETAAMQRAVGAIFARWGVSDADAAVILGSISPSTVGRWREGEYDRVNRDLADRMSSILGIHIALRTIFAEPAQGYAWMRQPNQKFDNSTPLALLLDGGVDDLHRLRRYLDSVRVGW